MGTASIRQAIADAIAIEERNPALHNYFARQLDTLRTGLVFPPENAVQALVSFTRSYISYVPDLLDLVAGKLRHTGDAAFATPLMHMAEDFFLASAPAQEGQSELKSLLEEAFLAHRLVEEVNDLQVRLRGEPLVAIDMTRANIIVHHLIGDRVANQLEALVSQSMALLAPENRLFAAPVNAMSPMSRALLPCMSESCNITLRLDVYRAQSSAGAAGDG